MSGVRMAGNSRVTEQTSSDEELRTRVFGSGCASRAWRASTLTAEVLQLVTHGSVVESWKVPTAGRASRAMPLRRVWRSLCRAARQPKALFKMLSMLHTFLRALRCSICAPIPRHSANTCPVPIRWVRLRRAVGQRALASTARAAAALGRWVLAADRGQARRVRGSRALRCECHPWCLNCPGAAC